MTSNASFEFIPAHWKRFVEIPYFTNKWRHLGLSDEDLHALQLTLIENPRRGTVMKGTGGLRKIRFSPPSARRGKSSAYRVGYVYFEEYDLICLLAVFAKKDEQNVPKAQQNELRRVIGRLHEWIATERGSGS